MYIYKASQRYDEIRMGCRSGVLASGCHGSGGWRWADGEHRARTYAPLVEGMVATLRALGIPEAELQLERVAIVIESALVDGKVEYAWVAHYPGAKVRGSLRRYFALSWAADETDREPHPLCGLRPRRSEDEVEDDDVPMEPASGTQELLRRAAAERRLVRILWHPRARKTSAVKGEGWYLQRDGRTSHTFHVGEPSICQVELIEVVHG